MQNSRLHVHVRLANPKASLLQSMYKRMLPGAVTYGPARVRSMITGDHTASSISCAECGTELGWKYLAVPSQEPEFQRKLHHYVIGDSMLATGTMQCSGCSHPILGLSSVLDNSGRFRCHSGVACMYSSLLPGAVKFAPARVVAMMTGDHTAADISCAGCDVQLGWKYLSVPSQEPEFLRKLNNYVIGDSLLKRAESAPSREEARSFARATGTDACTARRYLARVGWDLGAAKAQFLASQ